MSDDYAVESVIEEARAPAANLNRNLRYWLAAFKGPDPLPGPRWTTFQHANRMSLEDAERLAAEHGGFVLDVAEADPELWRWWNTVGGVDHEGTRYMVQKDGTEPLRVTDLGRSFGPAAEGVGDFVKGLGGAVRGAAAGFKKTYDAAKARRMTARLHKELRKAVEPIMGKVRAADAYVSAADPEAHADLVRFREAWEELDISLTNAAAKAD